MRTFSRRSALIDAVRVVHRARRPSACRCATREDFATVGGRIDRGTDFRCVGRAIICAVLASLPAFPHDSPRKPCTPLRAARIIATRFRTGHRRHSVRSFPNNTQPTLANRSEASPASTTRTTMEPMKPMSGMKPLSPMKPMEPMKTPERWWPQELGENPNSAGGQNETRYAFFGDKQPAGGRYRRRQSSTVRHRRPSHLRRAATPERRRAKGHVHEPARRSLFGDA